MTIWEMVCEKWTGWFSTPPPLPVAPEDEHYNPLKIKLGNSSLTVDTLELRKYTFVVKGMAAYKLDYGIRNHAFTDYFCNSRLSDENVEIKVRVYPHDAPGRDLQTLVLQKYDEIDYDEGFKALLEDQQFNTMVDDKVDASFWRINETKTPYQAQVTEVDNLHNFVANEVWYWDYWRETTDEGGTTYKEFLFVEWDKGDTGRFTIWRGEEVPQSRISA